MNFEDRLIDLLCTIPGLRNRGNRDVLLRNLPELPVLGLHRHDVTLADLNNIVRSAINWGRIEPQQKHALEIVMDNSLRFIEGTELEQELNNLREQWRNNTMHSAETPETDPTPRPNDFMNEPLLPDPNEDEVKITMLGVSGTGKSSLLAAMCEQINNIGNRTIKLSYGDKITKFKIQEALKELRKLAKQDEFQLRRSGTQYLHDFKFNCFRNSTRIFQLTFLDSPGGWLGDEREDRRQNVINFLSQSQVVIIPIDAIAMMESDDGKLHKERNQPRLLTEIFKQAFHNINRRLLVMFAPVKCETYRRRRGRYPGENYAALKKKILVSEHYGYTELINFFQRHNQQIAVVFTPVETVGCVTLKKLETQEYGEPIYILQNTGDECSPEYAEKPLQYIIRFLIKLYLDQQPYQGLAGFFNRIRDNELKRALTEFANTDQEIDDGAILQGDHLLTLN